MKRYTLLRKVGKPYGKLNGKPFPTGKLGLKTFTTKKAAEEFYADSLALDKSRFIGEVIV